VSPTGKLQPDAPDAAGTSPVAPVEHGLVLLVEDDEVIATELMTYLRAQGFAVEHEPRGDAAVSRIMATQPALVLLDVNLPGKDGFEVCQEVRPHYAGPIIVLTMRGNDVDHVLALEFGADDFIPKPAQPRIVLAHVKAALRRAKSGVPAQRKGDLTFGRLRIDLLSRSAFMGATELALTTAEFDLLWLFASRAGQILSRNEIKLHLRGIGHDGLDRSIDMRVSRLRKLLGDDIGEPKRIKTVRGRGYLFNPGDLD